MLIGTDLSELAEIFEAGADAADLTDHCPECGAMPSEHCRIPNGQPRAAGPHPVRLRGGGALPAALRAMARKARQISEGRPA